MKPILFRPSAALALLTVGALALAACSSAAPASQSGAAQPSEPQPTASAEATSGSGISPILATTLLRTGTQRVSFLLTTPDALVKAPEVTVTTAFLGQGEAPGETVPAGFRLWPYAIRGAYDTELTFPTPGPWRLDIAVDDAEVQGTATLQVEVADAIVVPDNGAIPPASQTKTLASEGTLKTLTTDYSPDLDLYLVSVDEAIEQPRPAVVVFSSPAFCTTPTCGPQAETLSELQDAHPDSANFIHVEIYDNPHEIQGDLDKAKIAEAVREWGFDRIPHWFNESWTYILDSDGRIHEKFEGYVTLEELEETLQEVLPAG